MNDNKPSAPASGPHEFAAEEGYPDPPELKSADGGLSELLKTGLGEGDEEERYSRFTRLAARVFDAPASLIWLFDAEREWVKSRFGFRMGAAMQEASLCRAACGQRDVFVAPRAPASEAVGDEARAIDFFAAQALHDEAGEAVGCLAVLDCRSRAFTDSDRLALAELARLVEEEFSLNEALASTRSGMQELLERDAALPSATHTIAYETIESLVADARAAERRLGVFHLSVDNLYDMAIAHGLGRIQPMVNRWMERLRNDNADLAYIVRLSERGFVGAFQCDGEAADALARCRRLCDHARRETEHEDIVFAFQASAGLSVFPDHGDSGMGLIGRAQLAHSNQSWSRETSLFNAAIAKRYRRRSALRSRFESAVANGDLTFYAQPIVNNTDGAVAGVELLARWQDAELGIVEPTEFVPVIEPEAGPRRALVAQALETAGRYIAAWQAAGERQRYVAINVPGSELAQPDFQSLVDATLERHGIEGRQLVFELTERSVVRDFAQVSAALRRLTATGAAIAIDDFGSGYSSIAYLTRLPVAIVKLDKDVIQQIADDTKARKLADGIAALAHGQGLSIVAEGVETLDQLAQVRALGCEYSQGYLLACPSPETEVAELLERSFADRIARS